MRDRLVGLGVVGAALAVIAFLAACSSDPASGGQVWHVAGAQAAGATLTVTVRGGCPATVGTATDVARSALAGSQELLPTDREPTSGLICEYAVPSAAPAGASPAGPPRPQLTHRIALTQTQARQLAAAISKVSLAPPSESFHCPSEGFGDDTVIAFDYPAAQTVDLWYKTTGCRTLDNGDVAAFQGANPSFNSEFQAVFGSMAPD